MINIWHPQFFFFLHSHRKYITIAAGVVAAIFDNHFMRLWGRVGLDEDRVPLVLRGQTVFVEGVSGIAVLAALLDDTHDLLHRGQNHDHYGHHYSPALGDTKQINYGGNNYGVSSFKFWTFHIYLRVVSKVFLFLFLKKKRLWIFTKV